MNPNDIPTPRTDAASFFLDGVGLEYCEADFARQLERELAEKTKLCDAVHGWITERARKGYAVRDTWEPEVIKLIGGYVPTTKENKVLIDEETRKEDDEPCPHYTESAEAFTSPDNAVGSNAAPNVPSVGAADKTHCPDCGQPWEDHELWCRSQGVLFPRTTPTTSHPLNTASPKDGGCWMRMSFISLARKATACLTV